MNKNIDDNDIDIELDFDFTPIGLAIKAIPHRKVGAILPEVI